MPNVPEPLRLAYYFGIGVSVSTGTVVGSAIGYLMTGALPAWLIAALLFMTPLYFLLSLVETSRVLQDRISLVLAAFAGPLIFLWLPSLDLLLTGLGAGTLGWAIGRRWRQP